MTQSIYLGNIWETGRQRRITVKSSDIHCFYSYCWDVMCLQRQKTSIMLFFIIYLPAVPKCSFDSLSFQECLEKFLIGLLGLLVQLLFPLPPQNLRESHSQSHIKQHNMWDSHPLLRNVSYLLTLFRKTMHRLVMCLL